MFQVSWTVTSLTQVIVPNKLRRGWQLWTLPLWTLHVAICKRRLCPLAPWLLVFLGESIMIIWSVHVTLKKKRHWGYIHLDLIVISTLANTTWPTKPEPLKWPHYTRMGIATPDRISWCCFGCGFHWLLLFFILKILPEFDQATSYSGLRFFWAKMPLVAPEPSRCQGRCQSSHRPFQWAWVHPPILEGHAPGAAGCIGQWPG